MAALFACFFLENFRIFSTSRNDKIFQAVNLTF